MQRLPGKPRIQRMRKCKDGKRSNGAKNEKGAEAQWKQTMQGMRRN